ncbi:lipopolysaccharide biosynthesis protein [Sphingobacterium sp. MYb382]|uniref:lipopolysaccharide biosynthesis protein n=1 Tax=Sphingobacterium sp. MYb382 TaxID=2745278 RepID=UPI0030B6DDB9
MEETSLKDLILNIQEWLRYFLSQWYILLTAVLIGASGGFFYTKSKKPIYTATTTFVLESGERGGGLGQYAGMAAMAGIDLGGAGGGIFQGDNLLELYKSRKMIEAALLTPSLETNQEILIDKFLIITNTKDRWKEKKPELLSINFGKSIQIDALKQRQRDSVIATAVETINKEFLNVGKPDKKLSIIKIDVKSENETFAKEFNEALVKEVNDFYVQTKTKKSLDNIAILQHKTDSVRAVMNGAIASAAVVIDATPNLNPTKQAQRIVPSQRSQFSAETNRTILGQLVQNLEMSKMALLKEAPLIQKVDEPIYPLKVESVGKLKMMVLFGLGVGLIVLFFLVFKKVYQSTLKD